MLRLRDSTAVTGNVNDGVTPSTGSVMDFFTGTVSVTGNGQLGLRCNGGQSFYSGTVTGVHDSAGGGNVDGNGNIANCPRF